MAESGHSLAIRGLSIAFASRDRVHNAFDSFELVLEEGSFTCVLGRSGCGKSTLLNVVAGLLSPSAGTVSAGGQPVRGPGPDRGYVFQDHNLFPWLTIRANIGFGLRARGIERTTSARRVIELAEAVGLSAVLDAYPKELSGGMRQRASLARAFANDPRLLLMDEPFGALDAITAIKMRQLLMEVWSITQPTVLFVTHNIDEALVLADRIIVLAATAPTGIIGDFRPTAKRPRSIDLYEDSDVRAIRAEVLRLLTEDTSEFIEETGVSSHNPRSLKRVLEPVNRS